MPTEKSEHVRCELFSLKTGFSKKRATWNVRTVTELSRFLDNSNHLGVIEFHSTLLG
jgi:hypothetical protein